MPLYGWSGPGKIREMDLSRAVTPELLEPSAPTLVAPATVQLFKCTVCSRKFKKAMIVARHFNSAHEDLKEEKDSWRLHVEEVWS